LSEQLPPKLAAARELFIEGQYDAARAILLTMPGDPTAETWLGIINGVAQQETSKPHNPAPAKGPNAKTVVRFLWIALIIIVVALLVSNVIVPVLVAPVQTIVAFSNVLPQTLKAGKPLLFATPTNSINGGWTVTTEVAPPNNTTNVRLDLQEIGNKTYFESMHLVVACDSGHLSVALNDPFTYMTFATESSATISYYFDNQAVQTFVIPQSDGSNYEFPDPANIVQTMRFHAWLTATYPSNNNQSKTDTRFNLVGFQNALMAMKGRCGQ